MSAFRNHTTLIFSIQFSSRSRCSDQIPELPIGFTARTYPDQLFIVSLDPLLPHKPLQLPR